MSIPTAGDRFRVSVTSFLSYGLSNPVYNTAHSYDDVPYAHGMNNRSRGHT